MIDKKKILILITAVLMVLFGLTACHAVESDEQGPLNNLNNFTAYTRNGDAFTQGNFADYDATLLCFWAPWSEPSIYELKHLVALSDKLPANVSFVSVCLDSDLKESKTRLKELNLKGFTTLSEGDGDFKVMCDAIVNVPTTIVVDSQGNLLDQPLIGIQENYEKEYLALLNRAMKQIGKEKIALESDEEEATEEDYEESTTVTGKGSTKTGKTSTEKANGTTGKKNK